MTGSDPFRPEGMPAGSWGAPPTARTLHPAVALLAALGAAVVGGLLWALLLDYADFTFSLIAVGTGSIVGALTGTALGRTPVAGVVAAVLTAVSCLVGEVAGVYARIVRLDHVGYARVHAAIGYGNVLRHLNGFAYIIVIVGAVLAYLAAMGRRNMFTGGGVRRRRF